MSEKPDMMSFLKTYEVLNQTGKSDNRYHKEPNQKVCKFCGQSYPEVTFNNIPHLIPELLSKNNYTYNDECDDCNSKFGTYENDLANFVSPYFTLIGQKTKNKIPTFQGRKQQGAKATIIKSVGGVPHINFLDNRSDFVFNNKDSTAKFTFKKKKFVPIQVYKSLVKIGMSLCPAEELNRFSKTLDWLQEDINELRTIPDISFVFRTRLLKKKFNRPEATLFRRINPNIDKEAVYHPRLCLIVFAGVLVFQLFIPLCDEVKSITSSEAKLRLHLYPASVIDINLPPNKDPKVKVSIEPPTITHYDMNKYEKVEEDEEITYGYDSRESSAQ